MILFKNIINVQKFKWFIIYDVINSLFLFFEYKKTYINKNIKDSNLAI